MSDDTDLSSMDPHQAREYVLAFVTTLRRTLNERTRLQEQLELWTRRVALARERGERELAEAAEHRALGISEQIKTLLEDERGLGVKVERLKSELRRVESTGERSVDAEALLRQLQAVAGEPDTTSEAMAKLEADVALEELKRKMGQDKP